MTFLPARLIMGLCGISFLLGNVLSAEAQVRLQYHFTPEDRLHYELKQTLGTESEVAGQKMSNTLTQCLDLQTHVHQVNGQGSARVGKTIQRIRMQCSQPGRDEELDYDSDHQREASGPLAVIIQSLALLLDQEIAMTLNPLGESSDVQIPSDLVQHFTSPAGSIAGINTEEGVKKMMSQGSLTFPNRPLTPQDQWSRELTTELPFGEMKSTIVYTYRGQTKEGLHRIDATSRIQLIPREGSPFQVQMTAADGQGVYMFDAQRGCLYASALKQTMSIEMTAVGQTVKQQVVTDITMRLVDPHKRTALR